MAKKEYSLDYGIERDTDRLIAVQEILDNLERQPTASDLETMASYILYGKDEDGKNAVQRKETTDSNKRYKTFQRLADKTQSLDEILENPLADQSTLKPATERYIYTKKKPTIARPKYDKQGNLLDAGDSDIPGMVELWESIDRIAHVVAVSEGKVPPDENTQIITEPYRLYQLKHQLVDMRRHQYYLKDAYKPTLHFLNVRQPSPQLYDWDSDAAYWIPLDEWQHKVDNALLHTISKNLEDYETRVGLSGETEVKWVVRHHTFDWENPTHIKLLIDNYSALYMQVWDKPDSWARTLIYDFDRYFEMCEFSDVREYILTRRIDRATYSTIMNEILQKFGIKYNENHICTVLTTEIPTKMARAAKRHRLILETPPSEKKRCWTCKQLLPRDTIFFGLNSSRGDGFSSNCKECEKKRRIEKGGQSVHDNRNKDAKTNLPKV